MNKLLLLLILIAAGAWIAYPYVEVYRLADALRHNDRATLVALVDLGAIKQDQRLRMEERANAVIGGGGDPISSLLRDGAKRLGESAVDTVIDLDWVRRQLAELKASGGNPVELLRERVDYAFFERWDVFLVRLGELGKDPLHFRLRFIDWHWRVVAVYPG